MTFHKQCILGRTNVSKNLCKNVVFGWILVSGHFSKGLLELLSDCLVLLLLRHKLILQPVHLEEKVRFVFEKETPPPSAA